ncbi:MAG: hypothetical protein OXC46_00590 [Thaumarchaeota archaeon]|nr:hypothetical protein [Nitrososphaerota archaeon]
MNVYEVVALTIHSNKDILGGRTAIQKLIYFVSQINSNIKIKPYENYFHGPFSREVISALEAMSAFSYLYEIPHSGTYEKYEYKLTKKGIEYACHLAKQHPSEFKRISEIVETCNELCKLNPNPLSYATKTHYILKNTNESQTDYTLNDVRRVATDFGWEISQNDADAGASLLKKLNLVKIS